jgi:hypothetical protein
MEPLKSGGIGHFFQIADQNSEFLIQNFEKIHSDFLKSWSSIFKNKSRKLAECNI